MKIIFLAALTFVYLGATIAHCPAQVMPRYAQQVPTFRDGWEIGWKEGWKYVKGTTAWIPPAPYPPYPAYGQDTYLGGYNTGFLAGVSAAQKEP